MGGHSSTSTSTQSNEKVTETNLQDSGGLTVAGNKGATTVNNISTDDGAVAAALGANTDVSQAALALGNSAISANTEVANAGMDNAAAAEESGLTFGKDALDAVSSLAQQFGQQQSDLVGNALSGYQSIAQQNSASDSSQLQKVMLWLIVGVVAIVFLESGRI